MLHKFYNSNQKHPKRFTELGELSQAYNQTHYLNPAILNIFRIIFK